MEQQRIKVLDEGYVELIESWGSDERIVESARMSTQKGFKGWSTWTCDHGGSKCASPDTYDSPGPCEACGRETVLEIGDEKFLAFLYNNKHMSPFEQAGLTVEVKAPIFVFREWHRHRTQSYNELSGRYSVLPNENYVPTGERFFLNPGNNKQAQSANGAPLDEKAVNVWLFELQSAYEHVQEVYELGIKLGVPKELARLCVPVARYSCMRASANLRNWLQFLTLRMDKAAQWEIRQYANVVGALVEEQFPRVWELFIKGK